MIILSITLFILGLPRLYEELSTLSGEIFSGMRIDTEMVRQGLEQLGLSQHGFAWIILSIVVGFAVFSILTAAMIVYRKFNDWLVLLVSLTYVTYGTGLVYIILYPSLGFWPFPVDILARFLYIFCGVILYLVFFFLFPDGRFIPRWSAAMAVFALVWGLYITLFFEETLFTDPRSGFSPPGTAVLLTIFISVIAAQIYRYRVISTPSQRQQTKWVVFGFSTAILLTVAVSLPGLIDPYLEPRRLPMALYMMAVIACSAIFAMIGLASLTIAILRYRLWDIDRLIRRTLIYSLLSGALVFTYFGLVVILQGLVETLTGGKDFSSVTTVLSTLAIAIVFKPFLDKIQLFVDNRFYQSKYQVEKVLRDFAQIARDEVNLTLLTESLVEVVEESVHPAYLSLWLKEERPMIGQPWLRVNTRPGEKNP